MKLRRRSLALAFGLLTVAMTASGQEAGAWQTDLTQARAKAAKTAQPLLVVLRCPSDPRFRGFAGLLRTDPALLKAVKPYLCVELGTMKGLDLNSVRFDYDLSFAVLLMNADGTVYHRYGSRDGDSLTAYLSAPTLARVLREGLETHTQYSADPKPSSAPLKTPEDNPVWMKMQADRLRCTACHYVGVFAQTYEIQEKTWRQEKVWRWPAPRRIGLTLDPAAQDRIAAVAADTPSQRAGLRAGDELVRVGGQRILSRADLSAALEEQDPGKGSLPIVYRRAKQEHEATLELSSGWRVGAPEDLGWRSTMWGLQPMPGFAGTDLSVEEKRKLGLAPDAFAFRSSGVILGGAHQRFGFQARSAGIRKDWVVLEVTGVTLKNERHFQAWWRLTRRPGDKVEIKLIRRGSRKTVIIEVIE